MKTETTNTRKMSDTQELKRIPLLTLPHSVVEEAIIQMLNAEMIQFRIQSALGISLFNSHLIASALKLMGLDYDNAPDSLIDRLTAYIYLEADRSPYVQDEEADMAVSNVLLSWRKELAMFADTPSLFAD